MTPIGETLRRARLKRNLELNRIADELKISTSMLKAIEDERFDKLPGGVFVRSFVRQYARLLELDEDEIVGELQRALEPESAAQQPTHATNPPNAEIPLPRVHGWQAVSDPSWRWSSSFTSLGLVVVVMLLCAVAYSWWQRERRPAAASGKVPVAARSVPAAPAVQAPVKVAEPAPEPAPAAKAAVEPLVPTKPETAAEKPAAPASASEEIAAPPAEANSDAAVRVEVIAEESVWISTQADGQPSFSGVLEANQSHTVTADRNVWLKIGNVGGVRVLLNGKPIGPLGAKGIVRTLQLTSGGFKILPPDVVPKAAPLTEAPNPL